MLSAAQTNHLHPLQCAMPVFAVLAAFSAYAEHGTAYAVLKPIPMVLMLACVWLKADRKRHPQATWLLLAALAFSLQGDVWLLLSSGFLPGLASFWLAHACYVSLLRRDGPWHPKAWITPAVLCGLAAGGAYTYLWQHGLPSAMRLPVLAYVAIIGYMAAHALARSTTQRSPAARSVAAGALCFMFSDTVLAINQFVQPVPAAPLWILGSYYLAQWLIVHGMLQPLLRPAQQK